MSNDEFFDESDIDDVAASASPEIQNLHSLAKDLLKSRVRVAELEDDLKAAKKAVGEIENEMSQVMDDIGIPSFKNASGISFKCAERYSAKITDANRAAAIQWLVDNGYEKLIKCKIETSFGRGEKEEADALRARLNELGVPFKDKEDVHHSTLASFVKEKEKAGQSIPHDLFSVFIKNQIKVG